MTGLSRISARTCRVQEFRLYIQLRRMGGLQKLGALPSFDIGTAIRTSMRQPPCEAPLEPRPTDKHQQSPAQRTLPRICLRAWVPATPLRPRQTASAWTLSVSHLRRPAALAALAPWPLRRRGTPPLPRRRRPPPEAACTPTVLRRPMRTAWLPPNPRLSLGVPLQGQPLHDTRC